MTALGKVVRTTAFKLSVIYFAVFSIFAVAFVLYLSWNTNALLEAQLKETIEARGVACGIMATDVENALMRRRQGFRMIGLGSDAGLLIRSSLDAMKALGIPAPRT